MIEFLELRRWIMAHPRPAHLRMTDANEVQSVIDVPGNVNWKELAETVLAMNSVLIECLDNKQHLLRAMKPAEHNGPEQMTSGAQISIPAPDPESARLMCFARLLAEAYKHANDKAFDSIVELVQAQNKRAELMEREMENVYRILKRHLMEQLEAAEEAATAQTGNPMEQMLGAALQGAAAAQVEKATNGKG